MDTRIEEAYRSKNRVRVLDTVTGYTRTGSVSRSCGPSPVYLLIKRKNSVVAWSSDVLGPDDRVIGVKVGRFYLNLIWEK